MTILDHISSVCQRCYYQLRQIRRVRKSLSAASKLLLVSCVGLHSRLDYIVIVFFTHCLGLVYAGTPLARISHRELIDKLYDFLTAFLQLRYELSVMSMRSL